jgi:hypothetical protein
VATLRAGNFVPLRLHKLSLQIPRYPAGKAPLKGALIRLSDQKCIPNEAFPMAKQRIEAYFFVIIPQIAKPS